MSMLLYSLALTLGLTLASPWWLTRMITTQRYREGLRQRLGGVPAALSNAVVGKKVIWLHAVSVGEVLAATRLVTELEQALGNDWRIVISTTTRTGQALAQNRFAATRVFYMPLDFAFAVRAYLRALNPQALILMESELWPRLLHECAARNIPVVVANARASDRSFARSMRFRKLWQPMARHVTLFLAQSDLDAERLKALSSYKTPVRTTGNLKYDVRASSGGRLADQIRTVAAGRPIIVAGSTVGGPTDLDEESAIIRAWEGVPREQHRALLVLAPRHPERFGLVESVVCEFLYARASDWNKLADNQAALPAEPSANNVVKGRKGELGIVLLNTVGDLASVYSIADVAFIGASLVKRGGHNPLEPASFGVPVIMGPSYENFRDIVEKMKAADGIRIVQKGDELEAAIVELLSKPEAARAMGERGRQVFEQQQGATQRTVEAILSAIGPGAPSSPTASFSARVGPPQSPGSTP